MALLLRVLRDVRNLSGDLDLLPPPDELNSSSAHRLPGNFRQPDDASSRFELAEGCARPGWKPGATTPHDIV